MSNPDWFDDDFYFAAKLTALKAEDTSYTAAKLKAVFNQSGYAGEQGLFAHFYQYGQYEGLSPNKYFDAEEYYTAKAAQYFNTTTVTAEQYVFIKDAIAAAGLSAWGHYAAYGLEEGVNPSNKFDNAAYMAAKLTSMQKADPSMTMEALEQIFAECHLSPLQHYLMYGEDEGFLPNALPSGATNPVTPPDMSGYSPKPPDTPDTPPQGGQFFLTPSQDTLYGGAGNDVFYTGPAATLQAYDMLDGGAGKDALMIEGSNNAVVTGATIRNIEQLSLANGSPYSSLDVSGNSGIQELFSLDRDATSFTLRTDQTVVFAGNHSASKVNFVAPGAHDVATIGVSDAFSSKGIQVNGIEYLNLYVTGSNSLLEDDKPGAVYGNSLRNLNIAGEKAASLRIEEPAAGRIDASNFAGTMRIELSDNFASTFIGGSGNDTVTSQGRADRLTGNGGNDAFILDDEIDDGFSVRDLQNNVATITDFSKGDTLQLFTEYPFPTAFSSRGATTAHSEQNLADQIRSHLAGGERSVQAIHYNGNTYLAGNADLREIDDDQVVCLVGTYDPAGMDIVNGMLTLK